MEQLRYITLEAIGGDHSTLIPIFDNKVNRIIAIATTKPDAMMITKRLNEVKSND